MKSLESPHIVLPQIDAEVLEQTTRQYIDDPIFLRSQQYTSAKYCDGMLLSVAGCIAQRGLDGGGMDELPDQTRLERELHFSMGYDLLNRSYAAQEGGNVDEVLDALAASRAHGKQLNRLLFKSIREMFRAPAVDESVTKKLAAEGCLPRYVMDTASSAFLETLDTEAWQEAVAGHDPDLFAIMDSQVMPVNAEITPDERERRLLGSVGMYALLNHTVARA